MSTMATCAEHDVVLADGTTVDVAALTERELVDLQWEQERQFALRIIQTPKGSAQRHAVVGQAYDTVTRILAAHSADQQGPLVMGMHPRHGRFVRELLQRQQAGGAKPRLFEIGYAGGTLLRQAADWGYPVAGIEVSADMQRQAAELLGPEHADGLLLGDLLSYPFDAADRFSLVYWNDVFEHIPPDEILDYLRKIHERLTPGGQLVTITPNWHVRPSDVTYDIYGPRTEARGLHLKEYTQREVARLLRQAGFSRVATPLCVLPSRIVLFGGGLGWAKRLLEPALEWLPIRLTDTLCRGLSLSCTIAKK